MFSVLLEIYFPIYWNLNGKKQKVFQIWGIRLFVMYKKEQQKQKKLFMKKLYHLEDKVAQVAIESFLYLSALCVGRVGKDAKQILTHDTATIRKDMQHQPAKPVAQHEEPRQGQAGQ